MMKRIGFIVLTVFLIINYTFGQTNNFPVSGNVNINTGNLIQKGYYHIETQDAVKLKNYILFDSDGDFTGGNYYTIQDDSIGNYLRIGYGFNNNLVINSSGKIGVGLSNPDGMIHTKGGIAIQNPTIGFDSRGDAARRAGIIFGSNHATNLTMFWISPDETIGNRLNIGTGYDYNDNSSKFTIVNNGNIGINTTNPQAKLHINGTSVNTELLRLDNEGLRYTSFINYSDGTYDNAGLQFKKWSTAGQFKFSNSNGDLMTILSSGNIGIGTTNPKAKLSVNGTILSKEIKVLIDVSQYPDFVFSNNYKLIPINELEKFINKNNHLPNIPKVNEVKNGIALGEMNAKLLQKIEELTLYIIDLNKKVENLEKQNKELAGKLKIN